MLAISSVPHAYIAGEEPLPMGSGRDGVGSSHHDTTYGIPRCRH